MAQTPVVFLACRVFEGHINTQAANVVQYLDYGLHRVPKQLRERLQAELEQLPEPSLVVLGYGLCGNGLDGLQAGPHTLVVPKVDDCVAIFLGSRDRYYEEFNNHPGTYYLTKGWLEAGSDPLGEYEALVEKYGCDTADWLMDQQYRHYRRLVFVAHSNTELETYRPRATQVATYCQRWGMHYQERMGGAAYFAQISAQLNRQAGPSEQFLVISPGETLTQALFR
ncbi:MAG: DUF1638 domain-containing protein [Anaerolineales bacterium]|nr:DUF1638 domain-containing protein [Anaerolineales bacterium]